MLWQGPLTTLYGRANEIMFPMPEEEKSDWKLVRSASNWCEFLDTKLKILAKTAVTVSLLYMFLLFGWLQVNDAGKTTFLPRPIYAIRIWNPVTRSYGALHIARWELSFKITSGTCMARATRGAGFTSDDSKYLCNSLHGCFKWQMCTKIIWMVRQKQKERKRTGSKKPFAISRAVSGAIRLVLILKFNCDKQLSSWFRFL